MQHVIAAVELAGRLDSYDVVRLLNDADNLGIAIGVAAELTELALADVVATRAESKLVFDV
jgi:hypothetical protein